MDLPRGVADLFMESELLAFLLQLEEKLGLNINEYIVLLNPKSALEKDHLPYYSTLFIAYPDVEKGDEYIHKAMALYTIPYTLLLEKRLDMGEEDYKEYAKREVHIINRTHEKLKEMKYNDRKVQHAYKLLRIARNLIDISLLNAPLIKKMTIIDVKEADKGIERFFVILYIEESTPLSIFLDHPSPHLKAENKRAIERIYNKFLKEYKKDQERLTGKPRKGILRRILGR